MFDTRKSIPNSGTLFVVATPIGNLEDLTFRALRILKEVSFIASEDTRHTKKLLNHFQVKTPLISYYRENEATKSQVIIDHLLHGNDVALVSDAGVPCISDPGFHLVNQAHENRISVVTIPGPSALISAISIAGMAAERFYFLGFLPSKKGERQKKLQELKYFPFLMVVYESPHRIIRSLEDCLTLLGNRQVAVCKELTKIYEQCLRGTLAEVLAELQGLDKTVGEYVILIAGHQKSAVPEVHDLKELLSWYHDKSELSLKDSVRLISSELDLPRSQVYTEALNVWKR